MNFARRLEALSDQDLQILLSRRPEVAALAGSKAPGWSALAGILTGPRNVATTLTRLDRFLTQVLQLACLASSRTSLGLGDQMITGLAGEHPTPASGRLTTTIAAREGLGRTELDIAARELGRWGLAFGDGERGIAVPPEVADLVWNPGRLGAPAGRLLENVTVEDLRSIALLLGLRGPTLPKRKRELADAVAAHLGDGDTTAAILRSAPPAARADLETLRRAGGAGVAHRLGGAWQRHYSWSSSRWHRGAQDGPEWLFAHGLVLPEDQTLVSVSVPAEVERALRGRVFARWDVEAPALEPAPLREERHPAELVIALDTLLGAWRHAPPPALKEGGAPKREIKRAAQLIGWSEVATEQLIALAFAAGLLRERELVPEKRNRSRRNPRVLESRRAVNEVGDAAGRWLELPEAERWLELALVWLPAQDAPDAAFERSRPRLMLELLGELEPGQGASANAIGGVLAWRYPTLFPDAATGATLARSVGESLASLGAGAAQPVIGLSDAGRTAFLARGTVDVEALERAFPAPTDRCVVTADHRVVVPGLPSGELARLLGRIAEVVSVHPARVYRLTDASLGKALDGGLTAPEILEALREHASGDIPQNVVVLVEDVARRHGRVRVGSAETYVVVDDPAHLELVARSRAVRMGGFRRVSPTVAMIDGRDRDEVMAALRREGIMPVADGVPAPAASAAFKARPRPAASKARPRPASRPVTEPAAIDAAGAARLAAALRAAPSVIESAWPLVSRADTVRAALVEAGRTRQQVEIGYRLASGAVATAVVRPYQAHGDRVYAYGPNRYDTQVFDPRRVLWVEAADGRSQHRPQARASALEAITPVFDLAADDLNDRLDADDTDDGDDDPTGDGDALLVALDDLLRTRTRPADRRRR